MKFPRTSGAALYWASQRLRGRGDVHSRLRQLRHVQTLSPAEVAEFQFEKLRDLLEHAARTVPYYRQLFGQWGFRPSEMQSGVDLAAIPMLTRETLLAEQSSLLSEEADVNTLQRNFSSGSTGARAEFAQDLEFRMWMRAHQLRTYEWCEGWRLGEPFMLLWGSEIYWKFKHVADSFENFLTNRRELNTFRLDASAIDGFLDRLVAFQPVLVSTYSNAMQLIVRRAVDRGLVVPSLRAVQGTSEPLPPALRSMIEETFGCAIYDKYGMRETNIVSHESPCHDGMLIQSENVYVEIVREDGQPAAPGEVGNVVVTVLNNWAMPLIRYRTSDLASFIAGPSASGLPYPRMTSVAGRQQDLIVTPSGGHVDAYLFSYLLMRFPEIHWFQVEQVALDRLLIRLYCPTGLDAETAYAIRDRIATHADPGFQVDLQLLDAMPYSQTGKFRLCVSNFGSEGR
jgi:phenylacetate-CoA ligase